jgi:hypothetical protein
MHVEDDTNQPSVVLRLKGIGSEYERPGFLGTGGDCAFKRQWSPFYFPIDDVPASGVDKLRLEFELKSAGRVWIDDVQVFDLQFDPQEFAQLRQIATSAADRFEKGDYGQCWRVLQGYWPRFLSAHVPIGQLQIASGQQPAGGNQQQPPKPVEKAASKPSAQWDKLKEKIGF